MLFKKQRSKNQLYVLLGATLLASFSLSDGFAADRHKPPVYDSEETDASYIPPEAAAPDDTGIIMPRQSDLTEQQKLSLEQAQIGQGLGRLPTRRMDGHGGIIYEPPRSELPSQASMSDLSKPSLSRPEKDRASDEETYASLNVDKAALPTVADAAEKADTTAQNCFSPQGVDGDTAIAVVQLVQHLPHGITTGTGFIVADSTDASTKENRIVTAKHVLNESYRTSVVLSDGTLIGTASPVSSTKRMLVKDVDGAVFGKNDLAVLEVTSFMPNQDIKYHDIKGIPLARTRSSGLMEGYISTPGGIERGASGSPVLNARNEAIGVVTQSFINDAVGAPRVTVTGWNGKWSNQKREFSFHPEQVILPTKTRIVADTLGAQSILSSLGAAGLHYDFGKINDDVMIVGYPQRTCVVYHGRLKSL